MPTGKPGVLIVDAGERSAVAACECLWRAGYRVGTASSLRPAPAEWSRRSERRFALPSPRAAPRDFASRVAEIATEHGYLTALPCSEGSLWALSANRDLLAGGGRFTLGMPEPETVERCRSKEALLEVAARVGLSAPETAVCADRRHALAVARRLGFPLVLKPRGTVFETGSEVRHRASSLVADPAALDRGLAATGWPCLLQRRETGTIASFGGVFADGRLLALAFSRYRRTWPPEAGSVCFSKSAEPPGSLVESVVGLVGELGWEGIFELELVERGGGGLAALDFNPRVYGSLALAARAGAPLPAVWCDRLLRGRREACRRAAPGFSYRWLDGDLRNCAWQLRRGHLKRAAAVLRPRLGTAHPHFRWRDPLPAAVRVLSSLRG
jgi:predicted ATP-grasp superfamily ATP-dependent carboligase